MLRSQWMKKPIPRISHSFGEVKNPAKVKNNPSMAQMNCPINKAITLVTSANGTKIKPGPKIPNRPNATAAHPMVGLDDAPPLPFPELLEPNESFKLSLILAVYQ